MEFLAWWFGYHWILSTCLSPFTALLYAVWGKNPGMMAFAIVMFCVHIAIKIAWDAVKEKLN